MKNTLNEIKSLMLRMEDTPNGGSNFINEVSCKWRMVVGEEEFFNVLAGLKKGNRVTFGYISQAKIVVPKIKNKKSYETLGKNLGENGKVINVIKLAIYNLPWQTQQSIGKEYGNWKTTRDALGAKFGVEFGKKRYETEKNNWDEKGGIKQYNGQNQDLTAHTYTDLNMYNIKPLSETYYLVMEDGTIKEVDVNRLELVAEKENSSIRKLKEAGATEEDVQPLIGMDYQRFEHSNVLFISATPDDGVPIVMINSKLSDKVGGITHTSQEAIINLAKERYAKFM